MYKLTPEKQEIRNELIKKYYREGFSIQKISKVFFTVPIKKIKEILKRG